jgi:hypothetical protein
VWRKVGAKAKAHTDQYVIVIVSPLDVDVLVSDIGVSAPDGVTRNETVPVDVEFPLESLSTRMNFSRAVLAVSGSNA